MTKDAETFIKDGQRHRRRSIRLKGYDYARDGAYFVTLCTRDRGRILGEVVDGEMSPNERGQEVARCWMWLARRYPYVRLDEWIIMPDRMHGILLLTDDGVVAGIPGRGGSRTAPTDPRDHKTKRKPPGRPIGAFKTASTKHVIDLRGTPGAKLWQRNHYEHVIRDEYTLHRTREYVTGNPSRWEAKRGSHTAPPGSLPN